MLLRGPRKPENTENELFLCLPPALPEADVEGGGREVIWWLLWELLSEGGGEYDLEKVDERGFTMDCCCC